MSLRYRQRSTKGDNNSDSQTAIREVLDLHGFTKEKAIQATTMFLDTIRRSKDHGASKYMVEIITGTGSHSLQGPVLRSAISSTLSKRQMDHKLSQSRGSFIVDALSGIDLYEDTSSRKNSKVVVLDRQDSCGVSSVEPLSVPSSRSFMALHHFAQHIHSNPPQDMGDDALLENVKHMSMRLAEKEHSSLQTKEELELKRAMLKSLEWKRIHELDMNDDIIETERAMKLSRMESEAFEHEYNKMIEQALKTSMESDQEKILSEREQQEFEWAMESSRNEYEALQAIEHEQLRQALELSSTFHRR